MTKKDTKALQEAKEVLHHFHHTNSMSNGAYLDKFHGLVDHYEHHRGQLRMQETHIQGHLHDFATDNAAQTVQEQWDAKEQERRCISLTC